jgi:uncharacterized protein with HEPN domain
VRGRQAFEADEELIQSWIVRHLPIIGEVARALPEAVRAQAPAVARNLDRILAGSRPTQ